jgi:hypothetical protein
MLCRVYRSAIAVTSILRSQGRLLLLSARWRLDFMFSSIQILSNFSDVPVALVLQHEVDDAADLSSIIGQRYCVTKICPPARHGQPYHRTTISHSFTPFHTTHGISLLEHPDSSEDIKAIGWYIRPQDMSSRSSRAYISDVRDGEIQLSGREGRSMTTLPAYH